MSEPNWDLVPDYMQGGLRRWIEDGILPGGFLTAVLENNLRKACGRADSINRNRLFDFVEFLFNYAPSACWGSPEKVQAWIEAHQRRRREEGRA